MFNNCTVTRNNLTNAHPVKFSIAGLAGLVDKVI